MTHKETVFYHSETNRFRRIWTFWKRLPLSTALVLYVFLPLAVVAAFLAAMNLRLIEQQVEQRMQHELEIVAKAIEQPLQHAFRRGREGSIERTLESAFSMSHVYGAYFYDADGQKMFDSAPGDEDEKQIRIGKRISDGVQYGEYERFGGRNVYSYFVPLTDSGGRIAGLLQLTRRRSDFQDHIRAIRYKVGGGFLLTFLVLTGMVVWAHHRVLGKHLRGLIRCIGRISSGNRQERFVPAGPQEIFALGDRFNRMLDTMDLVEQENQRRQKQEKNLESRLLQAEKLAAIGKLAAGVAHELGTPLSLIEARTQRMLRDGSLPAAVQRTLHDIRGEAARMERIIRQLMDFSRRNPLHIVRIRAEDLIRSAVAAIEHEAQTVHTELIMEPGPDLYMNVDPVRIEQALTNLLRNGIQAAPGGRVQIRREKTAAEIVFTVEDNGPGFDEKHKEKIFEPFFTTKAVGQGTGLGLAVVHGIAAEHGGRIDAVSTIGKGASFRLHLPLQPDRETQAGEVPGRRSADQET